ncbi:hypothetical protein [Geodermatophilus amargosae]|nr:hypothetical protein [Geodermatophilus amargosae]
MTTTTSPTHARRASAPARRGAVTSLTDHALLHRALRSGTRVVADALTGIAFDEPCCPVRQRELVRWTTRVLAEVRAHAALRRGLEAALSQVVLPGAPDLRRAGGDAALDSALARARQALPLFARDVSAGAPALALALTGLADLVATRLDAEEDGVLPLVDEHVPAAQRDRVVRAARRSLPAGQSLFTLPWLLDACHPAERITVLRTASRPARTVLRHAGARHARTRDAVLGLTG